MAQVRAARPPPAHRGLRRVPAAGLGAARRLSHCALRARRTRPSRRAREEEEEEEPPAQPALLGSGPGSASETGLRKAKDRRKSFLCRLLRNTARRARSPLPAYTCWDSHYKSDTRLISRQSLCTGQKEGALMTTCHRLNLRKPLQWSNK